MGKKFFDVFPTLKLDTGLKDLYGQVTVEKVSSTKRKDFLRVYISSDRLIQKEDVFRVEGEIKRQFFPNISMVIKIYEKFRLSAQYTPQKLMEVYRDSILLELREYSPVEYNLFKKADINFTGEQTMLLTMEDTVLGKSKAEELIRILEKIYNERCGFSVEVLAAYKECAMGKYKKEDEHRLAMQIAEISARAGYGGAGQELSEYADYAGQQDGRTLDYAGQQPGGVGSVHMEQGAYMQGDSGNIGGNTDGGRNVAGRDEPGRF